MPNNIDMSGFGSVGSVSVTNKLGGIETFGAISNTTLYPIQAWYANGVLVGRITRDGAGAATFALTNGVGVSLAFLADALTGTVRITATVGGFLPYIAFAAYSMQFYMASTFTSAYFSGAAWIMPSGGAYGWSSNSAGSTTSDTQIVRDAANIVNVRNGTDACTFRVTRSYTDGSNYVRLALNTNLTGDWLQIAAETAGTGADNYNLALTPSGTGAISAQVPDSTATGGNARGTYAVDFQRIRATAGQVASGSYSYAQGQQNTASGQYAFTHGSQNTATGTGSVAFGSTTNVTGDYAFGAGYDADASGSSAVAFGYQTLASGAASTALGRDSTTRGLYGAIANASVQRAAKGDAQVISQPVRRTTAATTTVQLSTDGSAPAAATVMVLPNNSGGMFTATVAAYQSTGAGGWKIEGTGYRGANAASTVIQGATTITAYGIVAGIGAPTVDVVADTTLGALVIQITPANATSTYWAGKLELIQVA